jgi:hypothetical protein
MSKTELRAALVFVEFSILKAQIEKLQNFIQILNHLEKVRSWWGFGGTDLEKKRNCNTSRRRVVESFE